MMKRAIFLLCLFLLSFGLATARDMQRPIRHPHRKALPARHLDEESAIALTITLYSGNILLNWHGFPDVPNWAVLRSASPMMASAETLAVTPNSSWTDTGVLLVTGNFFYQVLPLFEQPPPDSVIIIEDFETGSVTLLSIDGQDDDPSDWEVIDWDTYNGSDYALRLFGDTWKKEEIEPIALEFNTIWQVAMKLDRLGEVHAIGIADSLNFMRYTIWGSEMPESQNWIPVYEGWFEEDTWIPIYLPVGEDWHGRFGYLPRIREVQYINDNDYTSPEGRVLYDEIRDVTGALPYPPEADFNWSFLSGAPAGSVRVQFNSAAYDPDSPVLEHVWDFGDGQLSTLQHPEHIYREHSRYSVTLTVTDDTDNVDWYTEVVEDPPVTQTGDFRFAFVGDITLGRGLNGWDVEPIFDPTRHLTEPLELAHCNMESPLTTATTQHPTKGICFKADPDMVAGIKYAGFDFACLANNHILDYMEDGLQETQYVLDTAGIAHTGCGMNDLLARRTRFISCEGISIAMLCFSDRTGSYNNYQPFLDAGRSRAGFAMWNRSAIEATVPEAVSLADFTVLSVHSGSEYKTQPQILMQTGLPDWDPEVIIFDVVPDTTERLLRQYAIENGADLVVTHHPHVIQGFEVYQGKLIAHSMGNFVFDLSYAECFPSLILHTHFSSENGIDEANVHAAYLDSWIPQHATGGLGRAVLDYESEMSRRLDTWLVRQPGEDSARIIWDTTLVSRTGNEWTDTLTLSDDDGWWISTAYKMQGDGYPVSVEIISPGGAEVRVGREMLWFGNMEDEGSSEWNLSNDHETYNEDYYVSGARSVRIQNEYDSPWDYESNLHHRKSMDDDLSWSFVGWIMTQNAGNSMIEIEYWTQRGGGTELGRPTIGNVLTGDNSWTFMSADLDVPNGTNFYDVFVHHFQPTSGTGYAYFDDLALIQWEDWQSSTVAVLFPSDFTYLQVRTSSPESQAVVHYRREWIDIP